MGAKRVRLEAKKVAVHAEELTRKAEKDRAEVETLEEQDRQQFVKARERVKKMQADAKAARKEAETSAAFTKVKIEQLEEQRMAIETQEERVSENAAKYRKTVSEKEKAAEKARQQE